MSQKYINTKTLLKDVVFEEAHGLMAGSSTSGDNNSGGGPLPVGGDTEVEPDDGD